MSKDPKAAQPGPTAANPSATQSVAKGVLETELKRIISYISHLNESQKKLAAQLSNIEKRIDALDKAIGNVMTATGKAVADRLAPIESTLADVIDKSIRSTMTSQIIPQIKAAAPTPAPVPVPASTPARTSAPAPPPTPAAVPTPRRPSDVPDTKVATVIEANENIINDLKNRQRVQREYLKPLIEQARDTAMNNLSSRAKAAGVYKELIALLKSSPSDLPPDTTATVVAKLEDLNMHIRSS
jgi:hypothetical protein